MARSLRFDGLKHRFALAAGDECSPTIDPGGPGAPVLSFSWLWCRGEFLFCGRTGIGRAELYEQITRRRLSMTLNSLPPQRFVGDLDAAAFSQRMTAEQASTLKRLANAAYELDAYKPNLTRAEANLRIATLAAKLKLLDGPPHAL